MPAMNLRHPLLTEPQHQLACSPLKESSPAPGVAKHMNRGGASKSTQGASFTGRGGAAAGEGALDSAAGDGVDGCQSASHTEGVEHEKGTPSTEGVEHEDSDDELPQQGPRTLKRQLTRHVVTRWYRAPELILLQVSVNALGGRGYHLCCRASRCRFCVLRDCLFDQPSCEDRCCSR